MKLSLTIIAVAFAFALTNAPAFAHEWDTPSESPAAQFNEPAFAMPPVGAVNPNPTGVQWDLNLSRADENCLHNEDNCWHHDEDRCHHDDIEYQHSQGNTTMATGALDNVSRTTFKTSRQTPSGLQECRTCTLAPGGGAGLPTTSLAIISK